MSTSYDTPFEIHVHGDIPIRADVSLLQLQDALRPLWTYKGATAFAKGVMSNYEEEPGIFFDENTHALQMCWTVSAREDFRQNLEEMCMNMNEIAAAGAAIEVSIYDTEYDEDEDAAEEDNEARDDFLMLFVGPTPADIMQVQRDMLIEDVIAVMERHFDKEQLHGVVAEVDKLFSNRYAAMLNSLAIPASIRNSGGTMGSHGGGRKPRHSHGENK